MLTAIRQLKDQAGVVTDIDRRKCSRRVPMKVLVLGMPRTGSTSLKSALEMLGFFNVYHGEDAFFLNPRDCEMWMEALDAKYHGKGTKYSRKEFDQLLGHCQAVSDMPAICFGPELVEAYPEAKVILPTRDLDGWHKSAKRFDEYFSSRSSIFFEFLNKALFMRDRLALPTFRKAWQILFKGGFSAHSHLLYEKHYSAIASSTPKDRLLYWTFNDGWEPLCKFLDQPIPDTPFPHLNTARALEEGMRSSHLLMAMQYALRVTSIAAYATLILGLWRICSI
ncbi:P-loop containing nucleoside triphosphate hydrolase protein [Usnea florida]